MEISTLNNQEYVTLVGHYNQVGDKILENQLIARNYTPEGIKKVMSKMKSAPISTIRSLNVEFNTSKIMTFEGFGYYYGLYRAYSENGVLPFEGCLADQPAKIIEIFDVFEQLKLEVEKKQLKEYQKNNG